MIASNNNMIHWPMSLAAHEREIEADCIPLDDEDEADAARAALRQVLVESIETDCPPPSPPPFKRGDRILFKTRLHHGSYLVRSCIAHKVGGWQIAFEQDLNHRLSAVYGFVNCDDIWPMPAGWVEPPRMPSSGRVAFGLDTAAWAEKEAADAADSEYQAALERWEREFREWWRRHVEPLLAK